MLNRAFVVLLAVLTSAGAWAFQEVPKASAKALGVTRGKAFSAGFVFVNGKYLKPPYTIERWGTGIRINQIPVTGQVIAWDEFLKTQSGVKVETIEVAPPPVVDIPKPVPAANPEPQPEVEISVDSLDALFDDAPAPKKTASKPVQSPTVAAAPAKPKATLSYSLEGDFVMNAASKQLVARINAARTEIDRQLRTGGFIFFGDRYSRIVGDARTASRMIDSLPELMKKARSAPEIVSGARSASLYFLSELVAEDIYLNRYEYRQLQERRAEMRRKTELNDLLNRSL